MYSVESVDSIIDILANEIQKQTLTIFIGPYFTQSNGYPDVRKELRRLRNEEYCQLLIDSGAINKIDKWLDKDIDTHRVAQAFHGIWNKRRSKNIPQSLEYHLGQIYRRKHLPNTLYKLIHDIPTTRILTVNFDLILQNFLPPHARKKRSVVLNEETAVSLLGHLEQNSQTIYHLLGKADAPADIRLRYPVFMNDSSQPWWREVFHNLFQRTHCLFIGFLANDYFLRHLADLRRKTPSHRAWSLLLADNETVSWADGMTEIQVIPLSCLQPTEDLPSTPEQEIENAYVQLLSRVVFATTAFKAVRYEQPKPNDQNLWQLINAETINASLSKIDTDSVDQTAFFHGSHPQWSDIHNNYDFIRDIYPELLDNLLEQKLSITIIRGPSGSGKTTLAMRTAYELHRQGFKIIWVKDLETIPSDLGEAITNRLKGDLLLVLDKARSFADLRFWIKKWQNNNKERLRILIVGRSMDLSPQAEPIRSLRRLPFYKCFELGWLSRDEAQGLIGKLEQLQVIDTFTEAVQRASFAEYSLNNSGGDLLACLLSIVHGKDLRTILQNVCEEMLSWRDGQILLRSYIVAAALDRLRIGPVCTRYLFGLVTGLRDEVHFYGNILSRLPGELELDMGRRHIETRHPVIAEIICNIVFSNEDIFSIKETDVYGDIIAAVDAIGPDSEEFRLRHVIPRILANRSAQTSVVDWYKLAEGRLTLHKDAVFYNSWALTRTKVITDKSSSISRTEIDFIRSLYKKAYDCNPTDIHNLNSWAGFEEYVGELDEAIKIYRSAIDSDPTNAHAYQGWALLEKRQHNYNDARKLFEMAAKVRPADPTPWQAYAIMEKERKHYHEADRLFRKATEIDKYDAHSWQSWALLKADPNNPHKDINQARLFLRKAVFGTPCNAPSWRAWSKIEFQENNVAWSLDLQNIADLVEKDYLSTGASHIIDLSELLHRYEITRHSDEWLSLKSYILSPDEHLKTEPTRPSTLENIPQTSEETYPQRGDIWPLYPDHVTDGLTFEESRGLNYMLAGLSERLKKPVVLIQFVFGHPELIYPINRTRFYPEFCREVLRKEIMAGHKEHPCEQDMIDRAKRMRATFLKGDYPPGAMFVEECIGGYRTIYAPFWLGSRLIGLFSIGKYALEGETQNTGIHSKRTGLLDRLSHQQCVPQNNIGLNQERNSCLNRARQFLDADSSNNTENQVGWPIDSKGRITSAPDIERALNHVRNYISALHETKRRQRVEEFLGKLRFRLENSRQVPGKNIVGFEGLDRCLETIREFFDSEYIGLFLARRPQDRYLPLVGFTHRDKMKCGVKDVFLDQIKANIPKMIFAATSWKYQQVKHDLREIALRGGDVGYIENVFDMVAFQHVGHNGFFCLGPLSNKHNYQSRNELGGLFRELREICHNLGLAVSSKYMWENYIRNCHKEELGFQLLVHDFKNDFQTAIEFLELLERRIARIPAGNSNDLGNKVTELSSFLDTAATKARNSLKAGSLGALITQAGVDPNLVMNIPIFISEPQHLETVIRNLQDEYHNWAKKKNIHIKIDTMHQHGVLVDCDGFLLIKMISNLLINAIRHGENGSDINMRWGVDSDEIVNITVDNLIQENGGENEQTTILSMKEGSGLGIVEQAAFFSKGSFSYEISPLEQSKLRQFKATLKLKRAGHDKNIVH